MVSKKTLFVFHKSAIFICSMMILIGCRRNEATIDAPISIHLFEYNNPAILTPIDKGEENGWKPLLNVDLNQSDVVIREEQIISYDWSSHHILLSSELKEPLQYDEPLPQYAYFVFALGDKPVVGGIILPSFSAVGSQIPVLYFSHPLIHPENEGIELHLSEGSYLVADPLFPLDDLDIVEQVKSRLLRIGRLIE